MFAGHNKRSSAAHRGNLRYSSCLFSRGSLGDDATEGTAFDPSQVRWKIRRVVAQNRHLVLGTISFTVCFAAWGLIGAFAPRFREAYHLNASETAFLVAVPVLLGSLARVPMGILTDRFGGRAVFPALMTAVAFAVWIVPQQTTYTSLLTIAFLLGLAGSSFAVGVGYVSRWTPAERQGGVLGIYGLGNIGQSAAVFLGPVLAVRIGT